MEWRLNRTLNPLFRDNASVRPDTDGVKIGGGLHGENRVPSTLTKRVTYPVDLMCAFGSALDRDDIETHGVGAPFTMDLQEIAGGGDDFAPLAPGHRGQRSAEIAACALAHLDDEQQVFVACDDVEFAGSAAQIACQHFHAVSQQIVRRQRFAIESASHAGIGHGRSVYKGAACRHAENLSEA